MDSSIYNQTLQTFFPNIFLWVGLFLSAIITVIGLLGGKKKVNLVVLAGALSTVILTAVIIKKGMVAFETANALSHSNLQVTHLETYTAWDTGETRIHYAILKSTGENGKNYRTKIFPEDINRLPNRDKVESLVQTKLQEETQE